MKPNNKEMEQALLWCFLIDDKLIEKYVEEGGQIEWFYDRENREIYKNMFELAIEGKTIDLLSIKNKMGEKANVLYLTELTEIVPHSGNYKTYIEELEKLYKQRTIIEQAENVIHKATKGLEEAEAVVEQFIRETNNVLLSGKSCVVDYDEAVNEIEKYIEENKNKKLIWYSWGIEWLDKYTKWIRKNKQYRIWAPSWVGKTNLIYQTIDSLLKQNTKVLFVSLENNIETTYIKLFSSIEWINPNDIESWKYKPNYNYLRNKKLAITDQLFDIWEIKREILKEKPDVVILDYIGLVNVHNMDERKKYDKYADEIKEFMQKNKSFAFIDLSNLNKDDDEERIRLHKWFNWSAKLRNNTDFALHMFYHRPFYEWKKTILEAGEPSAIDAVKNKKVITFLISKSRLWPDWVEEQFYIDFDKWIRYNQATKEMKEKWENLSF